MKRSTLSLIALAGTVVPSAALAQAQVSDAFARDRNISVRQRPHPGYEAIGGRLGAFTFFPRVQVSAETSDNIFATSGGEVSDTIARVAPDAALVSGWSRHALTLYASAELANYSDNSSENSDTYRAGATGRVDITRTSAVEFLADVGQFVEPRTNANTATGAASPIKYVMHDAGFTARKTFNRFRTTGDFKAKSLNYDDGRTAGGIVIDQDDRDHVNYDFGLRGDYAISPATAVFAKVSTNARRYDQDTLLSPARNSDGFGLSVGTGFDLTNLARGEVSAGYIKQNFDDATYADPSGLGVNAVVEYFPSQLTTITLTASRSIADAGLTGVGAFLASSVAVQVDHELLRNVVITGGLSYAQDKFEGIGRTDDRIGVNVGATYLVNRNFGVSVGYSDNERDSSGSAAGTDFSQQRLSISLVSQF